jgi:hypothetical protein
MKGERGSQMPNFVSVGDQGFNLDHVVSWQRSGDELIVGMRDTTFPHHYNGKAAERIHNLLLSRSVAIIQKGEDRE